jgi:hypothetical protein
MRVLWRVVGVAALAGLLGACASISGLSAYAVCSDPCDASTGEAQSDDVTVESEGSGPDGTQSAADSDSGVKTDGGGTDGARNEGAADVAAGDAAADAGGNADGNASTDAGDAAIPCPDGGCPNSTATGFSCTSLGACNGASSECSSPSGCFCSNNNQCKSGKCVRVTGENDLSCGSATNCTGSGLRDGYNCQLASPGIPVPSGATYSCPANSGFQNATLTCDSSHTNCYCTANGQCPSGHCIPSANNSNCAGGGPCSSGPDGGAADYRSCQAVPTIPGCPIYIGCPANTMCQYPVCYCTSDLACESGHCIPSSHNGNCSNCTGTGTDDGHGCMPAPSSVPCTGSGGMSCPTTLTPTPVFNAARGACLCVADSNCSSGKCVNADNQCTGTCSGGASATRDSEDCETAMATANAWSCPMGNCSDVSSPTGQCTAAGVPCWCTSDSECPSGTLCATWAGCQAGSCSGTGTGNAFHCVP